MQESRKIKMQSRRLQTLSSNTKLIILWDTFNRVCLMQTMKVLRKYLSRFRIREGVSNINKIPRVRKSLRVITQMTKSPEMIVPNRYPMKNNTARILARILTLPIIWKSLLERSQWEPQKMCLTLSKWAVPPKTLSLISVPSLKATARQKRSLVIRKLQLTMWSSQSLRESKPKISSSITRVHQVKW